MIYVHTETGSSTRDSGQINISDHTTVITGYDPVTEGMVETGPTTDLIDIMNGTEVSDQTTTENVPNTLPVAVIVSTCSVVVISIMTIFVLIIVCKFRRNKHDDNLADQVDVNKRETMMNISTSNGRNCKIVILLMCHLLIHLY